MGQKVNPVGLRLGINTTWQSTWFASREKFRSNLKQDIDIRKFIMGRQRHAGISKIEIKRSGNRNAVVVHTAKAGLLIGKKGADIDKLKQDLRRLTKENIDIDVKEIVRPELDAALVVESIAAQIEKRVSYRRALKKAVQLGMSAGAQGVKVKVSGRLSGAEIARSEGYREGRVPLHTLRADIDYSVGEAITKYGIIGIKVWIFKGEVFAAKTTVAR